MLKFNLYEKGDFHITFDVSVSPDAASHDEFSIVSSILQKKSNCSLQKDDKNNIAEVNGKLISFIDAIDEILPPEEAGVEKGIIGSLKPVPEKAGLQVNFHQNPYDTTERYWKFILNQGHFKEYFFNRINWYIAPKNEYVTPFPLHVDLESASTCNMNCPMCYRDELKDSGQMDFDLFKKAVDECAANNVFSIRLSWRGETLTHPRIKDMIAYATSKIKNVSFLTNAFYITEDMADCFIENKLSYLAVSFDGIGKTYESIRHPAKFEENYQRLAMLQEKKRQAGTALPQVRLCTIWPAIKENPAAYYETMKEVSDYIVCNPYINFKGPMHIKKRGFIAFLPL